MPKNLSPEDAVISEAEAIVESAKKRHDRVERLKRFVDYLSYADGSKPYGMYAWAVPPLKISDQQNETNPESS